MKNMKQYIIVYLLLLFFQIQDIIPQKIYSGKVFYTIKLKPQQIHNIENIENLEAKRKISKLINNASNAEALLSFNGTEAIYKVIDKIDNEANNQINLTKILGGSNNIYYSNYLNNEFIKQTESLGESFIIEVKKPNWNIIQKTKIIGGYSCFMAVDLSSNNKKFTPIAWFTDQIPVNFGPKEYFGLPGLILEVETSSFIITSNKIILNTKVKIKKPDNGKRVTQEEYSKILKKNLPVLFSK